MKIRLAQLLDRLIAKLTTKYCSRSESNKHCGLNLGDCHRASFNISRIPLDLNRKRQPILKQAIDAFREREASVRQETDRIDKLFTRNQEILGSRENLNARGYTGLTRKISDQAFDQVDDLFIMSKEVNR